jgi:perosamine synthetase
MKLQKILINKNKTIRDAFKKLNYNQLGFCLVEENKKIIGTVTDGDLRRSLLKKFSLLTEVRKIMNKNFFSVSKNFNKKKISNVLLKKKFIPILDKNFIIQDCLISERIKRIQLVKTNFTGNETKYVQDCLSTGWISSQGKYIDKFEKKFASILKLKHSVAVSNGTTALHLALKSLGINKNHEVLVPDFTFAATINSVIYCQAKPVLVDIEDKHLGISFEKIKKYITKKTKAIIAVHLYGSVVKDINKIANFCKKNKIYLIEDCAEAIGSYYNNIHVGNFGDAATFSFYGNKTITTGEGGMLCFKKKKFAEKARLYRDHGMSKTKKYWHEIVGYNYRLTNLQAAVGLGQLEKYKEIIKKKLVAANIYDFYLKDNKNLKLIKLNKNYRNSYWVYIIEIIKGAPIIRDKIISFLEKNGIEVRRSFYPLHSMQPYKNFFKKKDFTISIQKSGNCICLPCWPGLRKEQIQRISKTINKFFVKTNL